jgi:hypothetical protein
VRYLSKYLKFTESVDSYTIKNICEDSLLNLSDIGFDVLVKSYDGFVEISIEKLEGFYDHSYRYAEIKSEIDEMRSQIGQDMKYSVRCKYSVITSDESYRASARRDTSERGFKLDERDKCYGEYSFRFLEENRNPYSAVKISKLQILVRTDLVKHNEGYKLFESDSVDINGQRWSIPNTEEFKNICDDSLNSLRDKEFEVAVELKYGIVSVKIDSNSGWYYKEIKEDIDEMRSHMGTDAKYSIWCLTLDSNKPIIRGFNDNNPFGFLENYTKDIAKLNIVIKFESNLIE